jgi:hypothetical protein
VRAVIDGQFDHEGSFRKVLLIMLALFARVRRFTSCETFTTESGDKPDERAGEVHYRARRLGKICSPDFSPLNTLRLPDFFLQGLDLRPVQSRIAFE